MRRPRRLLRKYIAAGFFAPSTSANVADAFWGGAAWLAGEYQASLAIVHATPQVDATASGWYLEEEFRRYVSEKAKKGIDALQTQVSTASRIFINPGDPAEIIANAARDFGADLLVIGSHGAAGLAGLLLQNAYAVIRESPCPVISI